MKYVLPSVAVILIVPMLQRTVLNPSPFDRGTVRCVIAIDGSSPVMHYPVGYNYELLRKFIGQIGKKPEIFLGGREYLDSLKDGTVDIVVMHYADSALVSEEFLSSIPAADSSSWVTSAGRTEEIRTINTWLSHYFTTGEHTSDLKRFSPSYEPYRRASTGWRFYSLSPYDELIGKYAASIGWDRLMLTALVWQESKFRIEVRSPRGAVGLMQLMPRTASHFEAEDLLDPEENLSTAVKLIARLQKLFRDNADSQEELIKFTLAAYNAGEGRIRDCILYAASIGAPHRTWDDIVAVIPDMREDSILESETVKLGKFKGYETINYVSSVMSLYNAFYTIVHGQSLPGRRVTQTDTAAAEAPLSADTTLHQPQVPEED